MNTLVPTQTQNQLTTNSDEVRAALIAELRAGLQYGRGEHTLHREITTAERAVIKERYRDLHSQLRTVNYSDANKALAGKAVAEMFTDFNFSPDPKVKEQSIGWHVSQFADIPLFAVQQACADLGLGKVEGQQLNYRPTIAQIAKIARGIADPVRGEYTHLKLIQSVTTIRVAQEISMERSDRVAEGLRTLSDTLAATLAREDRERSEALATKTIIRNSAEIEKEWKANGLAPPKMSTGQPVSMALRANIEEYQSRQASQHFRDARNENPKDQGS